MNQYAAQIDPKLYRSLSKADFAALAVSFLYRLEETQIDQAIKDERKALIQNEIIKSKKSQEA